MTIRRTTNRDTRRQTGRAGSRSRNSGRARRQGWLTTTWVVVAMAFSGSLSAETTFLNDWGSSGNGNGQFDAPTGLAIGPAGNVYVTDSNNRRVQKFDHNGTYLDQWGSSGTGDGQFNLPADIVVSPGGEVYVADKFNDRIQKFDSSGNFLTKWGSLGSGAGQFDLTEAVEVAPNGLVYVADRFNDRVQVFDSSGVYQFEWGQTGNGDGQFNAPRRIATADSGEVYVVDRLNHRVQIFAADGTFLGKFGSSGSGNGQFSTPAGISVAANGNVYVAEISNHRIQKFASDGTYLGQWGTNGSAAGQFNFPQAVEVLANGEVYIADTGNHRIQRWFDSDAWVSGMNSFLEAAVGPGELLGPSLTLDPLKSLHVATTTTVESGGTLVLDGGSFTTNTLAINSGGIVQSPKSAGFGSHFNTLAWNGGTIEFSGAGGLTVSDFAEEVEVMLGNTLSVAQTTTIDNGSTLNLQGGGTFNADLLVIEDGGLLSLPNGFITGSEIRLKGPSARISGGSLSVDQLVRGDGRIDSDLFVQGNGEIRVAAGERLAFFGAINSSSGRVEVVDGEVDFPNGFYNAPATGLITARDATLRFGTGLTNDGSIGISFGTTDVHGAINNSGLGQIAVSGSANATFYGDLVNDGTIQVSAGSQAVYFGDVSGIGSFPGGGTNFFEGDLRPGASPGEVSFGGDVVLGTLSTTQVELAGTAPGVEYDRLTIAGDVSLAGELAVALIDGFFPTPGEEFEIMTFSSRSGEFDTVTGAGLIDPDTVLVPVYAATDLTLVTAIAGDVNLDGTVNGLDANVISANFLSSGGYADGDVNFDGVVNGLDANLISIHFLQSNPARAIPEPTTATLLLIGLAMWTERRRKGR